MNLLVDLHFLHCTYCVTKLWVKNVTGLLPVKISVHMNSPHPLPEMSKLCSKKRLLQESEKTIA